MHYVRLIQNDTDLALSITLYIQRGSDPSALLGTLNVEVPALATVETQYGDLHNSFLCGIRIKARPAAQIGEVRAYVYQAGDPVDQWLNGGYALAITRSRLYSLSPQQDADHPSAAETH